MKRLHTRFFALLAMAALLAGLPAFAGGPLNLNPNDPDNVERWPAGGANIPWNPDLGFLGPLSNAMAVAQTDAAFDEWENLATATATYSNNGPLPNDITVANFCSEPPFAVPSPIVFGDCHLIDNLFFGQNDSDNLSPIVYDADGSIFLALFGSSGVLGFASPDTRDANGTPIEAVSFLNGGAILGGFPVADFAGVQVHEFGHYSGLAHTVVNGQNVLLGDQSGPTPFNTYGNSPGTEVETMYPFAAVGLSQFSVSPHADDVAIFSFLYPGAGAGDAGTITGRVLAPNGTTPLTGVNVIARNVVNPFVDAVSSISGDRGVTGVYTINGLTPGADYTVHIDNILAGGFSTPPIAIPGPEEFYTGASESNNTDGNDPENASVTVSPSMGGTVSGVDVIVNTFPAGFPLPVGDDGSVELFMPFTYELCGMPFDSVFVNANGNLTFGSGDSDFTESAAEMLSDQPRIAGLWDDLNPSQGGTVTFQQSSNDFTVIYDDVPEWFNSGSNTFSITLSRSSNHIDIEYGDVSISDGLAGVSCGGAITSQFEQPEDLSALAPSRINLHNAPARYEVFSFGNPNDTSNSTIRFNGTTNYEDNWAEPNDSLAAAHPIKLPFDSIPLTRYTEIEPAGGDVDYYRFNASEGQTLVAEIISGELDSLIGLFNRDTGVLIDFDDDGGVGLLSQLVVPIPADGEYALAVTTFADFDFDGDGFSGGRYVLDVFLIDGILLDLGDDDFEEVALDFSFPFNGTNYSSVFVNSNGSLTFGAGDTDFTESVSDFLGGEPRIAGLWDDLSPNNGGLVLFEGDSSSATVSFVDVPEFLSTGANNFAITLESSGQVTIAYGPVTASDGLVGVTEGAPGASGTSDDLSALPQPLPVMGTTFQLFTFGDPFDLGGATLVFN